MKIDISSYQQGLHKSTGGLIRVFLKERDGKIDDILFTGDFFIFPEDSLNIMAQSLKNAALNKKIIIGVLKEVYLKENIDSPGATPEDFANAVMAATLR
ncbi:MAG: Lipoate-protein ligase A subunit 2 [Candidatus Argoarchaeum ethanivorans]|uniref:lipoate--protein ligase n=1 Tax=Candidatus Argoarchaeum ethanivorans TaxID=2608793 RepID=A0A811T914_9EURY|nr:MAG: Lipoate-protein ligase A subunit 2 [Candidatus Argoarchaeum ethanivorans]